MAKTKKLNQGSANAGDYTLLGDKRPAFVFENEGDTLEGLVVTFKSGINTQYGETMVLGIDTMQGEKVSLWYSAGLSDLFRQAIPGKTGCKVVFKGKGPKKNDSKKFEVYTRGELGVNKDADEYIKNRIEEAQERNAKKKTRKKKA